MRIRQSLSDWWPNILIVLVIIFILLIGTLIAAEYEPLQVCVERGGWWVAKGGYCMTTEGPVMPWDLTRD